MLDLSATTLSWAGVDVPNWYEGKNLFSKNFTPRSFVAAHKDRLDHTIDRVRTVRTEKQTIDFVRKYNCALDWEGEFQERFRSYCLRRFCFFSESPFPSLCAPFC
jgi:hypothetical protein